MVFGSDCVRASMHRLPLALVAALLFTAAPASAAGPIQPGTIAYNGDGGQCTYNFIFDGAGHLAGRTYIGIAAHCVEKVGDVVLDGDEEPIGRAAFVGNADETTEDFAFIEIASEHLDRVDPALKGHPEYPTGFTTPDETAAGDLIQMSGYGLGFGETQPTQEERVTVLQGDDDEMFWLSGPSVNGDSGGPFVHIDTGKALGIVSMYGFETGSTDMGPTVQGILAKAAAKNFPVTLRAAGQSAPAAPQPQQQSQQQSAPPQQPTAAQGAPAAQSKPAAKKRKKAKCKTKKAKRTKKCRRAAKKKQRR